jgi:hypothetical protein
MRVRVTEQDVTEETDLTIPPSLRRFDPTDLIAALARRVLWAAAHDARSARTEANHLLALVANADQSFPNMSTHLTPS